MRIILFFLLALKMIPLHAQISSYCKDSLTQVNPYYQCSLSFGGDVYNPVCGCDNVTYRNVCAAINWGGLQFSAWTDNTICGNVDFEFVPSAIHFNPIKFNIFLKTGNSASLYIYNRYGGLLYSQFFNSITPGQVAQYEMDFQTLEIGVYMAVVIVDGEKHSKKFAKIVDTTE